MKSINFYIHDLTNITFRKSTPVNLANYPIDISIAIAKFDNSNFQARMDVLNVFAHGGVGDCTVRTVGTLKHRRHLALVAQVSVQPVFVLVGAIAADGGTLELFITVVRLDTHLRGCKADGHVCRIQVLVLPGSAHALTR